MNSLLATILTLALLHPSSQLFAQGSLTPPGSPAATMKTLQQIEPRIDLQNAPAASVTTTNANYHFIINQPGSYYLSANVGVTKTHGILINATRVTLNLNGFEISRASGSGGNGIEIPLTSHQASIVNGSLTGFAAGIDSLTSRSCVFRDLSVSLCTSSGIESGQAAVLESCRVLAISGQVGIFAGTGSSLTNCTAINNSATYGIFTDSGCSLTNCTALFNSGTYAISAGASSSITNCSVFGNVSAATVSAGIRTLEGCTITHCTAVANTSSAATSTSLTGMGLDVGDHSTIRSCTASSNAGDGIRAGAGCTVSECTSNGNGSDTTGSGISAGHRTLITSSTAGLNKADGIRIADGGTVSNCTVNDNGGRGILANNGGAITRNLTRNNAADGIYANFSCQIEGNNCNGDGTSTGSWGGIQVAGQANRVESNNVTYAAKAGIVIAQAGNVIVHNTVKGGTPSFSIAANNVYGAIVDRTAPASAAVNGNSAPSSASTTDPLANFSY